MLLAVALSVLAAGVYAAGSVLQAVGTAGGASPRLLVRSPAYLAGLGCDGLAFVLSVVALRTLPVFVVQSLLAGSLALTVLLARAVLRTPLTRRDGLAIGGTALALVVVASAGRAEPAPAVTVADEVLLVAGAVVAALAGLLLARRGSSVALALVAGTAFAATSLCARGVTVPDRWWLVAAEPVAWAVVVSSVAGTLCYAAALARGPVGPATSVLWAAEVVVAAVVGVLVLGDGVRAGWQVPALVAVASVVAACAVLARSPAVERTAAG